MRGTLKKVVADLLNNFITNVIYHYPGTMHGKGVLNINGAVIEADFVDGKSAATNTTATTTTQLSTSIITF